MSEKSKEREALAKQAWDEAWQMAYSDGLSAGHPLGRSYLDCDKEWLDSDARKDALQTGEHARHMVAGAADAPMMAHGKKHGQVMMSAHALCPTELSHPARMRWMAEYFMANFQQSATSAEPAPADSKWPFPTPGTMCKGSVALGSGCGICLRCKEEKARLYAGNPKNAEPAPVDRQGVALSEREAAATDDPLCKVCGCKTTNPWIDHRGCEQRASSSQGAALSVKFNEDREREAFEDFVRSVTDPKNHHDDLARDEYAHDDYARWPTQMAWEAWKTRASSSRAEVERLRRIAFLIGSIFVHGEFKAETFNERELERLLREQGTFFDSLADFDATLAAAEAPNEEGS